MKTLIAENERRKAVFRGAHYNPVTGEGCCGGRVWTETPVSGLPRAYVPLAMTQDEGYAAVRTDADGWRRLRCRHDFEYWCAVCITIKDKVTARDIPFVLNSPQRRVAALLETDRRAGRPLRLIMLKARQWGGSTLVQMYMAWIQSVHCRNWHSLICAHVKDTAASIRGMYTKVLGSYPAELWEGDEVPQFRPFERSQNIRVIAGRGCRVTISSAENQDAIRGADFAMAHLSETAFWPETPSRSPRDLIRAICGSVALLPLTLIAMESTANGAGNFFHTEWLRCSAGKGDKRCVFVPWYEIEIYRMALEDGEAQRLYDSFTDYERGLWERGLTLEMIKWYRHKSAEYASESSMQAEYPTTAEEAFVNSGAGVFDMAKVERLRAMCRRPLAVGDMARGGRFVEDGRGAMQVWEYPVAGEDYVASVDIGGRTAKADWSVITVMARGGDRPRVAAQWRGHIDHDLLAAKAVAMARMFNEAQLIVESNTLEQEADDDSLSVLTRMAAVYDNMYMRECADSMAQRPGTRIGFHTNRRTKPLLINTLIEYVRESGYEERDAEACNELATYALLPNGSYAARPGNHDDILMTRALALYALNVSAPSLPQDLPCRQDSYL